MEFICTVNILYKYGKKLLDEMLADQELGMQELIVMLVIHEADGILQSKLINFTAFDKGNFSKFLKQLEQKSLIMQTESQSFPGQNECHLTAEGKVLVPYLRTILSQWEERLTHDIAADDLSHYQDTNIQMTANIFNHLNIRWD